MGISFPIRFICDDSFIRELLVDKTTAKKVILSLSEIHKNSKHYPMAHNLILDECFLKAIEDKKIRGHALLGAMHPEQCPRFLSEEKDMETKIIKYAIHIANKKPYGVLILTSKEKKKEYLENDHYKDPIIESVIKISTGEEAVKIINLISEYIE